MPNSPLLWDPDESVVKTQAISNSCVLLQFAGGFNGIGELI